MQSDEFSLSHNNRQHNKDSTSHSKQSPRVNKNHNAFSLNRNNESTGVNMPRNECSTSHKSECPRMKKKTIKMQCKTNQRESANQ